MVARSFGPRQWADRPAITGTRLSALDVWAFVLPAVSFIEIVVVGRLILAELLMLLMLPWLWSARDRLAVPRWFVAGLAGWLFAQILTDIIVASVFEDYVRGWAAIVFTFTDFLAVVVLAATPRRARLFAMGLATAGLLGFVLFPTALAGTDPWKWGVAGPVGLALASALSGPLGGRRIWLVVAAFTIFAGVNLFLGFRSMGGVSLLTAGCLVVGATASGAHTADSVRVKRWAVTGLAAFSLAVVGVLQLYDVAASAGLLGAQAQAIYRSQTGALGVLVGGRSEVLVSGQAVIDSPILGHGSVAKDFAYVDLLTERRSSLGYEGGAGPSDIGLIPAHSYLMGSWVWSGVLGALFWAAVAVAALKLVGRILANRLELAPLLAFAALSLLWNIAFSPYAGDARTGAVYGIALCLLAVRPVRELATESAIRGTGLHA